MRTMIPLVILVASFTAVTAQSNGVSAEQCSFPFTLNGKLYYKCIKGSNGKLGCFTDGRVWKNCISNTNYQATTTTVQVNTGNGGIQTFLSVGGWLLWMQRLTHEDEYNRPWADYRDGFGTVGTSSNFWVGLEKIHYLTTQNGTGSYKLRAEFQSAANGLWYSVEYGSFWLSDEANLYKLNVSSYSGDADDAFNFNVPVAYTNGYPFNTVDRYDSQYTPGGCANLTSGGWWFNSCTAVCFTCYVAYGRNVFLWDVPPLSGSTPGQGQLTAARLMIKKAY